MGKGRKKAAAKRATVSKEDMAVAVIPARKKKDWKEDMPDREFKNERQVDITKLDKKCHGIPTIEHRGLEFWFNPLEGYNKEIVVEFYQNMVFYIEEPNQKDYRVESKVGRIPILVTPDEIAHSLQDITDYEGKYAPGSFMEEYRFINKVINANLYPRGSESLLRDSEAELLYAFMNDKYVIDVAEMIFYQIVNFQLNTHFSAKMPFPCMITKFCQAQGVKGKKYEKL
ncbi:hypothetical protein Vadar_016302 [Vaccinium darrowii]|uniref:Uncharacterized protein n=1 Tax=Vaccinium darrowii TaxID=229202 RepID=A0ACB7Y074_9ERIC|nr:hypothetical protein Vadar_016302 [Vaccinium darrowii]